MMTPFWVMGVHQPGSSDLMWLCLPCRVCLTSFQCRSISCFEHQLSLSMITRITVFVVVWFPQCCVRRLMFLLSYGLISGCSGFNRGQKISALPSFWGVSLRPANHEVGPKRCVRLSTNERQHFLRTPAIEQYASSPDKEFRGAGAWLLKTYLRTTLAPWAKEENQPHLHQPAGPSMPFCVEIPALAKLIHRPRRKQITKETNDHHTTDPSFGFINARLYPAARAHTHENRNLVPSYMRWRLKNESKPPQQQQLDNNQRSHRQ